MADVAMIVQHVPYGTVNAAEAVRHALGAVVNELSVDMLLVDGGVLLAKKGQDDAGTGLTGLEETLRDCLDMGISVYADKLSLLSQRITRDDLVEGVQPAWGEDIAGIIKSAKTIILF
jgi:tRNA 2-thiouridine synthesizing protein D